MSKCDQTHSAKYENIKAFLLKELHLSPSIYLEKFNSLTQDSETYTQSSTRLMSLFDYYPESRKIGQSYDKLIDLMMYDRVKICLSPALSRYVLFNPMFWRLLILTICSRHTDNIILLKQLYSTL